jgi:hypothetical protein
MTAQALEAMARAEDVAKAVLRAESMPFKGWARDRVRLVARDRETLQRHTPDVSGLRGQLPETEQTCLGCTFGGSARWLPDCPEREAVIDYWTEDA